MALRRRRKKLRLSPEFDLQLRGVDYLLKKYPLVIFKVDVEGYFKPNSKTQKLRCGSGSEKSLSFPDFSIFEPRGGWNGLCFEVKAKRAGYAYGDGSFKINDKHLQAQLVVLCMLREKGYYTDFAGGPEELKGLIDWYMSLPKKSNKKLVWPSGIVTKLLKNYKTKKL